VMSDFCLQRKPEVGRKVHAAYLFEKKESPRSKPLESDELMRASFWKPSRSTLKIQATARKGLNKVPVGTRLNISRWAELPGIAIRPSGIESGVPRILIFAKSTLSILLRLAAPEVDSGRERKANTLSRFFQAVAGWLSGPAA
jgi:hypothetical protein